MGYPQVYQVDEPFLTSGGRFGGRGVYEASRLFLYQGGAKVWKRKRFMMVIAILAAKIVLFTPAVADAVSPITPTGIMSYNTWRIAELYETASAGTGLTVPARLVSNGLTGVASTTIPWAGLAILLAAAGLFTYENWDTLSAIPSYFNMYNWAKGGAGLIQGCPVAATSPYQPVSGTDVMNDILASKTYWNNYSSGSVAGYVSMCYNSQADAATAENTKYAADGGYAAGAREIASYSHGVSWSAVECAHSGPYSGCTMFFGPNSAGHNVATYTGGSSALTSETVRTQVAADMAATGPGNTAVIAAIQEFHRSMMEGLNLQNPPANPPALTINPVTTPVSSDATGITGWPGNLATLGNAYTYYYVNNTSSTVTNNYAAPSAGAGTTPAAEQDTSWVQELINAISSFLGINQPAPADQTNPVDNGSAADPQATENSHQFTLVPVNPTAMSNSTIQTNQNTYLSTLFGTLATATTGLSTKINGLVTSAIGSGGGACSLTCSVYAHTVTLDFCSVDLSSLASIVYAISVVAACLMLLGW